MKIKNVAGAWPLCLCVITCAAHADLSPYTVSASETLQHDSNLFRTDTDERAEWASVTEFRAALDQQLGREHLIAGLAYNLSRYRDLHSLDSSGYQGNVELDWSTVGDLSGAVGADASRHQYFYGFNGPAVSTTRNLQTDDHVFARAQLGGMGRWTILGGVDANKRDYSAATFEVNQERQWSGNGGINYSTSEDLSFGISGRYTRGSYPKLLLENGQQDEFSLRSIDLTTKWQASGNSLLQAKVGYSSDRELLQADRNFVNGSLSWAWTPPSRFGVTLNLSRDSNADTAAAGASGSSNILGRSVNDTARLNVSYALSAKVGLTAGTQFTKRDYAGGTSQGVSGTTVVFPGGINRTVQFSLNASYQPTRTTQLGCGFSREHRSADTQLFSYAPGYSDNSVLCTGSIRFE